MLLLDHAPDVDDVDGPDDSDFDVLVESLAGGVEGRPEGPESLSGTQLLLNYFPTSCGMTRHW